MSLFERRVLNSKYTVRGAHRKEYHAISASHMTQHLPGREPDSQVVEVSSQRYSSFFFDLVVEARST